MHKYQTSFREKSRIEQYKSGNKEHIAVVGGGMSAEREVSLVTAKAVIDALIELGYKVTFIDMGADIAPALANLKPDIVYNALHGTYGEDGCLQGLLNIMRIPYTHSGVLASSIAFCKRTSNYLFKVANINTIPSIILTKEQNIKDDPLPRPYVIKPLAQGSSIGVELVFAEDDFDFAKYDFPYGNEVIIEQYIKDNEFQVAVLDGVALGALEIKLLRNRFYDYQTKYTEGFAQHLYPAPISDILYKQMLQEAEKAYKIIGCKSIARVEFLYSKHEEKLYILELNTHPGMTPLSICPEIASYQGIDFANLTERILATASFEQ